VSGNTPEDLVADIKALSGTTLEPEFVGRSLWRLGWRNDAYVIAEALIEDHTHDPRPYWDYVADRQKIACATCGDDL
jgi:hypothetical protein